MSTARILVIDGHDGSGKSTVAGLLARRLGWVVARPFTGAVSAAFYRCLERGEYASLSRITRAAVTRLEAQHPAGVIFDRHWLTMLSVLPRELWADWHPTPPTLMCRADPATTSARVSARGETRRNTPAYHRRYCEAFSALAQRFGVPVLDTSNLPPQRAWPSLLSQHPGLVAPWT